MEESFELLFRRKAEVMKRSPGVVEIEVLEVDSQVYFHRFFVLLNHALIEPMIDKTQWPQVELPFLVGAPLAKLPVGRRRKLRRDGWKVATRRNVSKMVKMPTMNVTTLLLQPMQRERR